MCGPTKRRKADEVSISPKKNNAKHTKLLDWKDIFEQSLCYVDSETLVHASRSSASFKDAANKAAKTMVLSLIDFFVANGDVEFTEGIAYKRAGVETWIGLLYSLKYEPHEVTLTAFAAERFDSSISRKDVMEHKQDIMEGSGASTICKRFGFTEVFRCENLVVGERNICPYDGLPAHIFTFTAHSISIVHASKFTGALRSALSRRVKANRLARYRVDGWGSWKLTPLLRYENYFDFDADTPYRFHLSVPPYACLSSKWVLGSPLCSHTPKRRSLVLDLDETLIHTEVEPINDADFTFCLSSNEGTQKMFVRVRPHAKHFLEEVAKHFEVIVFTASERAYAEHVLKHLDPTGCLIEHVLCREDCTYIEGEFVKDLGSLKRDLTDVVLIDNRPEMYCYHADNGVPISSWFEDRRDCELLRLMPSLARLTSVSLSDVRSYVRHHWRTFEHVERVSQTSHNLQNMTPSESVVASPFATLQNSDWLNATSSEVGGSEEGEDSYYYEDDQKNSLFSIGTCSRSLNSHFFFKDME